MIVINLIRNTLKIIQFTFKCMMRTIRLPNKGWFFFPQTPFAISQVDSFSRILYDLNIYIYEYICFSLANDSKNFSSIRTIPSANVPIIEKYFIRTVSRANVWLLTCFMGEKHRGYCRQHHFRNSKNENNNNNKQTNCFNSLLLYYNDYYCVISSKQRNSNARIERKRNGHNNRII